MDDVSETVGARATRPRRFLSRGTATAIVVAVVVVLAVGAGGAYAYSDHTAKLNAIAAQAAAVRLADARTELSLAEGSAVSLQGALTAVMTAANGVADSATISALTDAVAALKEQTDQPAPRASASVAALDHREVALHSAVAAALAAVPALAASVNAVSTSRLAAASSASAATASAAKTNLAALSGYLDHGDDPRGFIIPTITSVKAAQDSSDAAVAAAAAAAAVAAAAKAARHSSGAGGSASFSADPGAPICAGDVLTCVNQIRAYYGLRALSSNGTLNAGAQSCAERMASSGQMTHSAYPGGWSSWGENIAEGYGSSVSVFNAWMASPGHRANILNASYSQMGIGHVSAGSWWCQQFGS